MTPKALPIVRLATSKKAYGGNIYETMVDTCLEKAKNYRVVFATPRLKGLLRIFELPKLIWSYYRFASDETIFKIRTFNSAFFPLKGKGITIVHHIDPSQSALGSWIYQKLVEFFFLTFIPKTETIVVVAKFWEQYLLNKGFRNVHLIHNGFLIEDYSVSEDDAVRFRQKYKLVNKKIIYIGNPQKKKGADLVYRALHGSVYELITTGEGDLLLPIKHLNLNFHEYLCLLKAAEVVITMSQFLEGWNRVAHEAMLVGTPVIGSGTGGMRELLEGGGQIICQNSRELPQLVEFAIKNRATLSTAGREYASQFSADTFNKKWKDLVTCLNTH